MGKILILGAGRSFGKTLAIELSKRNHEAIITTIEEPINAKQTFTGTLSQGSFEAIKRFNEDFELSSESLKRLGETLNSLKTPPENQPSKFISKPLHNYKKR